MFGHFELINCCSGMFLQGIGPVLPIFREGILNGPPEVKESAALGLGEVIRKTSPEALKPSVVNIAGPLIRILGDRYAYSVKIAMLDTLGLLLSKVSMYCNIPEVNQLILDFVAFSMKISCRLRLT